MPYLPRVCFSSLLLAVSEELESHEAAWSTTLPCQVCHGDANEANLMVNDAVDQVTPWSRRAWQEKALLPLINLSISLKHEKPASFIRG